MSLFRSWGFSAAGVVLLPQLLHDDLVTPNWSPQLHLRVVVLHKLGIAVELCCWGFFQFQSTGKGTGGEEKGEGGKDFLMVYATATSL